jgi:hypothetical protein
MARGEHLDLTRLWMDLQVPQVVSQRTLSLPSDPVPTIAKVQKDLI